MSSGSGGGLEPTVEDFEFEKPISKGAFGDVYLGHKKSRPENKLAIKVMSKLYLKNKNMLDRVQEEKNALAMLEDSNHIVKLFYCLQSVDKVYLVMEYLLGGDLKSLLEICGCFDDYMIAFYTAEIALALRFLNNRQIIHRDVKPDNCLIDRKGHVKLTDFGLAKIQMSSDINSILDNIQSGRTPGQIKSLKAVIGLNRALSCESFHSTPEYVEPNKPVIKFNFSSLQVSESGSSSSTHCHSRTSISDQSGASLVSESKPRVPLTRKRSIVFVSDVKTPEHIKSAALCDDSESGPQERMSITKSESTSDINDIIENMKLTSPLKHTRVTELRCTTADFDDSDKENQCVRGSPSFTRTLQDELRSPNSHVGLEEADMSHNSSYLFNCSLLSSNGCGDEYVGSLDGSFCEKKSDSSRCQSKLSGTDLVSRCKHDDSVEVLRCADSRANVSELDSSVNRLSLVSFDLSTPEKLANCDCQSPHFLATASGCVLGNSKLTPSPCAWRGVRPMTPFTPLTTPHRSVKSSAWRHKQNKCTFSTDRILGTPDYIAPEVILRSGGQYSFPVDWWSLGVCMFEFATGVLPFNDESAAKVLQNILNTDIPWPTGDEQLPDIITQPISALLNPCPSERATFATLRRMALFDCIADWEDMQKQVPPFVPTPCDESDTDYFQPRNQARNIKMTLSDI